MTIRQAVLYESMIKHRTRHPWCAAAVRGATAKMTSHEARLLQGMVTVGI